MIDLAPHHLETVRRILAEHVPGCEVRAFGSRAKWEALDYSDLDLVVVCGDEENGRAIKHLKQAFEESDLPIRVDVLDWHVIAEDFRKAIESECVVVQQALEHASWRKMTVGDFAPLRYGKSLPASKRSTSGQVPVYGSNGVTGYHDSPLTSGPTVIIGRKGTAGAVHYSQVPCWPIDTTFFVTGCDSELVRFKYYALSALRLEAMNSDSAVPGLNRSAAHALEMRVPDEQKQRSIARALGTLDDKIELNRQLSKTLEDMTQALFKSWFVDFDPVHAKAAGRSSGLPAHLDTLFPNSFQPSGLGPIPRGWTVKPFSVLARHQRETIDPSDFPDMVFDHYSIPAYDSGRMPVKQYGNAIKSHKFLVRPGCILASRLNPEIERIWLTELVHSEEAICSTEFLVLMPRHPFTTGFLYCHARSNTFRHRLMSLVTGTSRSHQRAPAKAAMSMDTLVPPSSLISVFDRSSRQLLESVLELRREVTSLVLMRDILLPRLVSGRDRMAHTNVSA